MSGRARRALFVVLISLALLLLIAPGAGATGFRGPVIWLGQQLYFDTHLSSPDGQSCASCHTPSAGYADPDAGLPVSEGVIAGRFGGRNAPSAAYAAFSPPFGLQSVDGESLYIGGQFWDGRAADLAAQAKGPFLNPVEMNDPDKASVVAEVRASRYAALFRHVYGRDSLAPHNVDRAYDDIADAIAAFESSRAVNSFSSRYDAWLAGRARLTPLEHKGLTLFNGKAMCDRCHPSGTGETAVVGRPLFTDYSYDNLGIPVNQAYFAPPLDRDSATYQPDLGLGVTTGDPTQDGMFKVPTLRNIAKTAPYGHNGYFATLKAIVHFYNTRDVASAGWPAPEVPATVNHDELGNLGLTPQQEDAIVAFLRTLSDRRVLPVPLH